jgi:aminoglycoside phosphotransferase (APT) family kinase protein
VWEKYLGTYRRYLTDAQVAIGERLGAGLAAWLLANRDGVGLTVTHGDYRLDNMMFGGPYDLAVVDWQSPGHGPGLADASYFLGAGLLPPDRRTHERELLEGYRAELVRRGVSDLSAAECWEQYRCYALSGCVMSVVASMIVGESDRSEAMFAAMSERHFTHAEDLAAPTFLP